MGKTTARIKKVSELTEFDVILGVRLKSVREARGVSQQAIAEYIGTSYQQVQRYESGQSKLSVDLFRKYSAFLEVSVDYLLDVTDSHQDYAQFDKKVLSIANMLASIRNPKIVHQVYQLASTIRNELNGINDNKAAK